MFGKLAAGRLIIACVVLLTASSIWSATPAERAEIYGALPDIQMLAISPDGATIAYRRISNGSDVVMVYSLADSKVVGVLTVPEDINPSHLVFATNKSLVLVVAMHTRMAGFRGKFDLSAAYVYNLDTLKLKKLLVPGGIVYAGQSGLGDIIGVSPDGSEVYMPAFVGNAKFIDDPNYSLLRVNLNNPRSPKPHFAGERRSRSFFTDQHGEVFIHEIFDDRQRNHTILVRDGDDWREIYNLDTPLREFSLVGVTPDYASLVIGQDDEETGYRSYFKMSLADGTISGKLFSRDDADVGSVIADLNQVVRGVRYSGFNPSYEFLDADVDRRMNELVGRVDGDSVFLVDWTRDWKTLIVYVEGSAFSGQFFAVTDGEEPLLLASARPNFDDETINPVVRYNYPAADGLTIPALLTIPRDRVQDLSNLPAVMLPHGGPAAYDQVGFDWFAQALADQGYLVIQPQFRGSTGFGRAHRLAGRGEWGKKMQSDLDDGLVALAAKGYIDPQRVCIVGMSYGGYAALAAAAFTPHRYRCAVSINGVSDLRSNIRQKEKSAADNEWITSYFEQTFGNEEGELDKALLDAISPAEHADAIEIPVLLLHGEDDEVVSVAQSKRMYSKLKGADKDVSYVELDDEGHHLSRNETRIRTMQEVLQFLDVNLGP